MKITGSARLVLVSDEFDLGPSVADATNVLLVASGVGTTADQLCCDVLSSGDTTPEHIVGVTITGSPTDQRERWRDELGHDTTYSFVSVDGVARSAAADTSAGTSAQSITVEYVDSMMQPRELAEAITDQLEDGVETAVCFDSVTDLFECVDHETAFNFLHVLGSRIRTHGATGYFHIDSAVTTNETLSKYSTVFDAVVEFGTNPDAGISE